MSRNQWHIKIDETLEEINRAIVLEKVLHKLLVKHKKREHRNYQYKLTKRISLLILTAIKRIMGEY